MKINRPAIMTIKAITSRKRNWISFFVVQHVEKTTQLMKFRDITIAIAKRKLILFIKSGSFLTVVEKFVGKSLSQYVVIHALFFAIQENVLLARKQFKSPANVKSLQ
jgi:hypothetical protein